MKLLLPAFALFLICSCSGKADLSTPEKFVDAVILSINNKDTAMFRSLHIDGDDFDQLVKKPANQYHLPTQKADYLTEVDRLSASSEYATITEAISGISTFQLNPFEKAEGGTHEFIHRIEFEIQTPDHHQKKIVVHELIFVKDHWKAGGGIEIEEIY